VSGIRDKVEEKFAALARWSYRYKYIAIAIPLVITAFMLVQFKNLRRESSLESFFHDDDIAKVTYDEFQSIFGKDDFFIIALKPENVFDRDFLKDLKKIHRSLVKEVPYLDDVTSLVNVRETIGEEDRLVVEDLMKRVPKNGAPMAAFKKKVLSNQLYVNSLVSADGKLTAIAVRPNTFRPGRKEPLATAEYSEMYEKIKEIAEPYREKGIEIHYAGNPVFSSVIEHSMTEDIGRMTSLSLILIALILTLMFRKFSGTIYPFCIVVVSVIATLGTMALLDLPISMVTLVVPTFLVVVGVADSVHILTIFYRRYAETGDKAKSISWALGHSGLAVLMTSLTTSAGILSFVTADVASIAHLGIVAPIGVMFAFFNTVILLPALLSLFPVKRPKQIPADRAPLVDRVLTGIGNFAVRRAWYVIGATVIMLGFSVYGMSLLRLSHNSLDWLGDEHPLNISTRIVDKALRGSIPLEIVIDTEKENGLYDAQLIAKLDKSAQELQKYKRGPIFIGKVTSIATVLKEVNRALNENREEAYVVPDTNQLVAQELLLFEMSGSNDLEKMASTDLRLARFTIMTPFNDAILYRDVLDDIRKHFDESHPGLKIRTTGVMALFINTIHNILASIAKSYTFALIVVTILMLLMLGRLSIGLLSMIPNLVPILAMFGSMVWLKIPFDMSTMMVGSFAIGLVVDNTIHFLHIFRKSHDETGDVKKAVQMTMTSTGRAILITTITLACGFFIFFAATMENTFNFGLLAGSTVLLAMVVDYFLAPALMQVLYGKKQIVKEQPAELT